MFTAPAGGNVTIDLGAGTMTDSGMSLYSGTCGSFTEITCDNNSGAGNMSQITATTLTAGTTYFIRVWSNGSGTGTFTICVQDNTAPCAAPANDNPCSATTLTVGATCTFGSYTNECATASTGVPAPGCASYSGGDVWFQVTVPTSGSLTFDSNTGVITDGGMAIYSGTCASLTLITCDDDGSTNGAMPMISQGGLTPGSTIWIRFWEYGNNNNGTFSLCVTDAGAGCAAPANDNPCSATTVTAGSTCTYTTYTNACATASSGVPAPGCASYSGGDVWFQVTVPASGDLIINSNTGTITDGGMAVYSGTCASLTLLDCDDDGSTNGAMPMLTQTGLTPGSTLWIRMWEYGNDNNGTFGLCVTEPPPAPDNTTCGSMDPICSDTPITFTAGTDGTDADIANPGNDYGCLSTSPNPTWYYLELLTGGTISIDMSAGSDIDFALWGPYANLASAQASCNSYPAPIDCSYSTSATEQANVTTAVANQVYVLLVTNYADVTQIIDLNSGAGNTAATDCSIILPIELTDLYATTQYTSNTIHWITSSELSNDHFIVERSYDGTHFDAIGEVDGAGNSSVEKTYTFVDRDYQQSLAYYRLKQVDFDGAARHSVIVAVNRDLESVVIYPNPTSSSVTFNFPNQKGSFVIGYSDMMGQSFSENVIIENELQSFTSLLFDQLPSGIYMVEIRDENGTLVAMEKIVKRK